MGEAHRGVKGFVKDESLRPIEGASMKVRNKVTDGTVYKRAFQFTALMLRLRKLFSSLQHAVRWIFV